MLSNHFVENLKQMCMSVTQRNAENVVKSGKYQQFYLEKQLIKSEAQQHVDHKAEKREERRKKASSGKGGGGTQGRETKTKAVKKHVRPKHVTHDSDSDDGSSKRVQVNLEIVSVDDIETIIKETLENEGLDDLLTQIAEYLQV